jgi:hypothetical protein
VEAASERRKAGAAPKPRRAKSPAKIKHDDVAEMTKSDLVILARDLDIAGRSTMARPALEKAVAKALRRAA